MWDLRRLTLGAHVKSVWSVSTVLPVDLSALCSFKPLYGDGNASFLGMRGGRVGEVSSMTGKASQPFWAQMPQLSETAGRNHIGGRASPPFRAQMYPLSGGDVGGNLRPRVAPRYRNFHPSRGGNLVHCLGLCPLPVFDGQFNPYKAGVPLLGRRTGDKPHYSEWPSRPPKKLFPPFRTYLGGGGICGSGSCYWSRFFVGKLVTPHLTGLCRCPQVGGTLRSEGLPGGLGIHHADIACHASGYGVLRYPVT